MLTDIKLKNAKPAAKLYKLSDGQGLQVMIYPNGSMLWQLRYRFNGREKTASLGKYPLVSLAEARTKRDDIKRLLSSGKDPVQAKRQLQAEDKLRLDNKFKVVAEQWQAHWSKGCTERHAGYVKRRLESHIYPVIGDRPINELRALDIVRLVKKIESKGTVDIAKRAFQMVGAVFRYAVLHGLIERDPTSDVRLADLLVSRKATNYARIDAKDLPELMHAIEAYSGANTTRLALRLMALTFVRTKELIGARWEEFDLNETVWRIPAERMKMRSPHVVPLSRQAIETLETLRVISGHKEMLFPGERDHEKSMSNNTILKALERMGFKGRMTGHGFRGLASTILHEHGFDHAHIELQLAHQERDRVASSYNYATYLKQRAQMMQWWADRLDAALGRNVISMPGRARA